MDPGAVLFLKGDVQLTSDLPKQCFSATWKKGDKMTYFQCKDCKLNWICTPCAESCHKVRPFASSPPS